MTDILQMVLAVFFAMAMAVAVPLSQEDREHKDWWLIGWPRGPHYYAGYPLMFVQNGELIRLCVSLIA